MTDILLQKVEEKVMVLLSELESSRKEISQLKQEVTNLRSEKNNNTSKLQGLVSLLDVLDFSDSHSVRSEASARQEDAVVC